MSRSAHTFLWKSKQVAGMAIGAIAMLAVAGPALAQDTDAFKVTTAIKVGTNPLVSFDISWFDPKLKKYFLADRSNNQIDVISNITPQTPIGDGCFAGLVMNTSAISGPDGVLTVHRGEDEDEGGVTELWVGDSPGKVWVFNAVTGANILSPSTKCGKFIDVGGSKRADELCFDSEDHLIMIASPNEGVGKAFVTFISTDTHKVVTKLVFDGNNGTLTATDGLEQCGWSPKTGKFYINEPGQQVIAVIDPETVLAGNPQVMTNLPVAASDCDSPAGMAIGPDDQIMLGCGVPNTAMVNINSGATLKAFPNQGGADEVWFNKGDGHYFFPFCNTACRSGTGLKGTEEFLGVVDSSGRQGDQSVVLATTLGTTSTSLARRAHSVAADPDTLQVYVPLPASCLGATPACGGVANDATMCEATGITKVDSPTALTGCILVLKGTPDADDRVARAGENDNSQGENDNSQD